MTRDYIHAFTPVEIAAQVWCEPKNSHTVMDLSLCESITDAIAKEQKHTNFWHECAVTQQEVLSAAEAIITAWRTSEEPMAAGQAMARLAVLLDASAPRQGDPHWRARVPTYAAASASAKQEELL